MPMAIGGKRGGEPLMLGPSKRVNIEEYNEFAPDKNTYQEQNQLVQSYQGEFFFCQILLWTVDDCLKSFSIFFLSFFFFL